MTFFLLYLDIIMIHWVKRTNIYYNSVVLLHRICLSFYNWFAMKKSYVLLRILTKASIMMIKQILLKHWMSNKIQLFPINLLMRIWKRNNTSPLLKHTHRFVQVERIFTWMPDNEKVLIWFNSDRLIFFLISKIFLFNYIRINNNFSIDSGFIFSKLQGKERKKRNT